MLHQQPHFLIQAHQPSPSGSQSAEHPSPCALSGEKEKSLLHDSMERTLSDYQVLIVHYRSQTSKMMATMFRRLGYRVATALDSTSALLSFGRKPYDLLFTDLDMPTLNGYYLARQIKRHRPQAKAVAMTCRCQAELVEFMGDGIIDGWLFKPFNLTALSDTLTNIGVGPENYGQQIKR